MESRNSIGRANYKTTLIATLTCLISCTTLYAQGISPDEGLVSYWNFEGTTADIADLVDSGTGDAADNLTAQAGTARYVEGVVGQALAIGAEGGDALFLDAPVSPDVELPHLYTIECWVYPTELAESWQRLVLRWGAGGLSYHFAIRNEAGFSNAVSLFHSQEDGALPNANGGTVVLNEWQHIAGVADGTDLIVYLNGAEVARTPYDGTITAPHDEGLGIADAFGGPSAIRFNGYLDELAIWALPLTEEEILSHFEAGPDGYGLTFACEEDFDSVSVTGRASAAEGETISLTAEMMGVDAGNEATYAWELVEGTAALSATDTASIDVTLSDAGTVRLAVTAGDGVCTDDAGAQHTVTVVSAPDPSPASGLVSYWNFDDNQADVAESYTNNSGATVDNLEARGGEARFVDGWNGRALALGVEPGDATWLAAIPSDDVHLPATYTIEAWINPSELTAAWQRFVLKWGSSGLAYHFAIRNNGTNAGGEALVNSVSLFHAQSDGGTPNANGGTVVLGEWQHIAGVADGNRSYRLPQRCRSGPRPVRRHDHRDSRRRDGTRRFVRR